MVQSNKCDKGNKLKAFLEVSRANLLLASIGHATLGMFLAAASFADLLYLKVPLFIALHFSIAFLACNVNCLYDHDVDKKYKIYMSDSVDVLGKSTLKWMILGWFSLATLLIAVFVYWGLLATASMAILGVFAAVSYSAEPLRIKRRGAASQFPIFIGLYVLPILGGWFVFRAALEPFFVVFLVGYALMNEGFTLVNMCEDTAEDREAGIRTWAHILGLKRSLYLAYIFSLSGILCVVAFIYKIYATSSGPISLLTLGALLLTAVLIIWAGFEVGQALHGDDLEGNAKRYGKNLQKWFIMTRYPLILTALLLLV